MSTISLAEAKAHLSELVARAAVGEIIQITRRGKPIAQITAITKPRKPIDFEALRELVKTSPKQPESAGEFMRKLRDDARY